jgi:hypothetical protein
VVGANKSPKHEKHDNCPKGGKRRNRKKAKRRREKK